MSQCIHVCSCLCRNLGGVEVEQLTLLVHGLQRRCTWGILVLQEKLHISLQFPQFLDNSNEYNPNSNEY